MMRDSTVWGLVAAGLAIVVIGTIAKWLIELFN